MSGLSEIPIETIASGIVGLLTGGAILRSVFKGWIEAKAQAANVGANAAAMVSAVSIGFDKDERTAIVSFLERIAKGIEAISVSQAALVNEQSKEMDGKLDELLAKMDDAEAARDRNRRASDLQAARRKPRPRAKRAGA